MFSIRFSCFHIIHETGVDQSKSRGRGSILFLTFFYDTVNQYLQNGFLWVSVFAVLGITHRFIHIHTVRQGYLFGQIPIFSPGPYCIGSN